MVKLGGYFHYQTYDQASDMRLTLKPDSEEFFPAVLTLSLELGPFSHKKAIDSYIDERLVRSTAWNSSCQLLEQSYFNRELMVHFEERQIDPHLCALVVCLTPKCQISICSLE